MDELDNTGIKGSEGGADMKFDFFDHLVTKLSKEINDLMVVAKNALFLPEEYINKQKKESTIMPT